jgi:hypothetical protein
MSAIEKARRALLAAGCTCDAGEDGGFAFADARGRGRVDGASATTVGVALQLGPPCEGPLPLARLCARAPAGIRITVRDRRVVAAGSCLAEQAGVLFAHLVELRTHSPERALPVDDLAVGLFDVGLGDGAPPAFLRCDGEAGPEVDAARAWYLLYANGALRSGKGGWIDGPGLVLESAACDRAVLRRELLGVGQACRALRDGAIARSYLDLWCLTRPSTRARVEPPGTETKGEQS